MEDELQVGDIICGTNNNFNVTNSKLKLGIITFKDFTNYERTNVALRIFCFEHDDIYGRFTNQLADYIPVFSLNRLFSKIGHTEVFSTPVYCEFSRQHHITRFYKHFGLFLENFNITILRLIDDYEKNRQLREMIFSSDFEGIEKFIADNTDITLKFMREGEDDID